MHSDAFPAFAEDVPPRIVKGACGGGVVWLHYGERGGKRFRPSETGRGWIGLTDLNYRIIRQKYQNLTPACFAAL